MSYYEWPPLTVRAWQGMFALRNHEWGTDEGYYDDVSAASLSRRLHELRGVIIGQVAEIEALMIYISTQIHNRFRESKLPARRPRSGAGAILRHVQDLLDRMGLKGDLEEKIQNIKRTIDRRNKIVHATIHVGYAHVNFTGTWDPVIVLLLDNEDKSNQAKASDDLADGFEDPELDETRLELQLAEAYEALDACLDIWETVNARLPMLSASSTLAQRSRT